MLYTPIIRRKLSSTLRNGRRLGYASGEKMVSVRKRRTASHRASSASTGVAAYCADRIVSSFLDLFAFFSLDFPSIFDAGSRTDDAVGRLAGRRATKERLEGHMGRGIMRRGRIDLFLYGSL